MEELRDADPPVARVPRTGVFLNASGETTPLALRANVEHNHVLHECVVIVSIETLRVPHVPPDERRDDRRPRLRRRRHQPRDGAPRLPGRDGRARASSAWPRRKGLERDVDVDAASFFLSRMTIVRTDAPGMAAWRKRLFMTMARNARDPVTYFGLPDDRTVVMGSHVKF